MPRSPEPSASLLERPLLLAALGLGAVAVMLLGRMDAISTVVGMLDLPDNDDMMRLQAVRDWLGGQGWFDTRQYRYLPTEGAEMHWSRYVDAPIAALILILKPFAGDRLAERLAAALWPLMVFGAYLAVLRSGVRALFNERAGWLCLISATSLPVLLSIFAPGRIDHHNVQITLIVAAGLLLAQERPWRAALSGALCGLSLAVGLETLPFVAVLGLLCGGFWIVRGRGYGPVLLPFGLALGASSLAFHALQVAPSSWMRSYCDTLSSPWLFLTGGGTLVAAGLVGFGSRLETVKTRLVAAGLLGGLLVLAFAALFPACLGGPYGSLPQHIRDLWLDNVQEAAPVYRTFGISQVYWTVVVPLPFAWLVALYAIAKTTGRQRSGMIYAAGLLGISILVSLHQTRGILIGIGAVPFVAGWALDRLCASAKSPVRAVPLLAYILLSASLFSQTWLCAFMLAQTARLSDEASRALMTCQTPPSVAPLDDLPPGTVLGQLDLGAPLLLHTRHSIVVAPYHRNVDSIQAAIDSFLESEAEMKRRVERHAATYVVICGDWLVTLAKGQPEPFANQLMKGATVPWLDPVEVPGTPLRVWRVRPASSS